MAKTNKPIDLVIAAGKKHLTKAEIAERRNSEVGPLTDNIEAPAYLTKKQKETFYQISEQLQRLKIMSETDVDALSRYIIANDQYIAATKKLRTADVKNDPYKFDTWSKIQERYFKQTRTAANDLGLTISSRCKLVVPKAEPVQAKANKFAQFEKRTALDSG